MWGRLAFETHVDDQPSKVKLQCSLEPSKPMFGHRSFSLQPINPASAAPDVMGPNDRNAG